MVKKSNKKTYWPHMILGFLTIGITLGYWTVKHAISLPVQESNEYMLKYQKADMNINEIVDSEALFDKSYTIKIIDAKKIVHELENAKRAKEEKVILLHLGQNRFKYSINKKDGSVVSDANVTFLLTRPHTRKEDVLVENVKISNDKYIINDINITKAGRYTLQLRAKIGDATGYSQLPAYIKP
jgi:hypothetical protein